MTVNITLDIDPPEDVVADDATMENCAVWLVDDIVPCRNGSIPRTAMKSIAIDTSTPITAMSGLLNSGISHPKSTITSR